MKKKRGIEGERGESDRGLAKGKEKEHVDEKRKWSRNRE